MGKLNSYTYVSLDGIMSSPETWVSDFWSDPMNEDLTRRLTDSAAMVLGRNTYNEFAGFWPRQSSDVPFADLNNQVQKYVVSHALKDPEWHNSTAMGVEDLFQRRSEGDLHIAGSRQLILSLLEQRLLDEIVLMMCPIVLGEGQRLFDGAPKVSMELVEMRPFPKGVLCLRLKPET